MKREIKFKAKRLDGKGWVYGDLIQDHMGRYKYILPFTSESLDDYEMVNPETICQYNSVLKAYENDTMIVDNEYSFDTGSAFFYKGLINTKCTLIFNDVYGWFFRTESKEDIQLYLLDDLDFKITGNKHD